MISTLILLNAAGAGFWWCDSTEEEVRIINSCSNYYISEIIMNVLQFLRIQWVKPLVMVTFHKLFMSVIT